MIYRSNTDVYYRLKIKKAWFRGKNCFPKPLSYYEKVLINIEDIQLPLSAGNMIYCMMQTLEEGVDWKKQTSLMAEYRSLVYRLSYTICTMRRKDLKHVYIEGMKSDVMWTLSFITQVYSDEPMFCSTVAIGKNDKELEFKIQNGDYTEKETKKKNGSLPDIWAIKDDVTEAFNPYYEPQSGETFVLPDGRKANYIRMDERYYIAKTKGIKVDDTQRHNISAGFIKDFENIVRTQTKVDFDTHQMRYKALMNKAHQIEDLMGGFEVSVYDILPIAERGLPTATQATVDRANLSDKNSLKYLLDMLKCDTLDKIQRQDIGRNIMQSVSIRQKGYEAEYRNYIASGTDENVAKELFKIVINELYNDFALIDTRRVFKFGATVYRDLCNVPAHRGQDVTDWERKRIKTFGKGYLDFLSEKIKQGGTYVKIWQMARYLLDERYIKPSVNKKG